MREFRIKHILVPTLKPGQVVVMDNASFHKSNIIKKAIEKAKCSLIYLPPYSPDFNPIEHFWHTIKSCIRKILKIENMDLYKAAKYAFNNVAI